METARWVKGLFEVIDAQDTAGFGAHLTEDVVFIFGNGEPVRGRENVEAVIAGFYQSIAGLSHRVDAVYEDDGVIIARGAVTYTRHDGRTLTVPFSDIFDMERWKAKVYQIYVDTSLLYQPDAA